MLACVGLVYGCDKDKYKNYWIDGEKHKESTLRDRQVSLLIQGQADQFIKELSQYTIDDLSIRAQSLEDIFLQYYGGDQ